MAARPCCPPCCCACCASAGCVTRARASRNSSTSPATNAASGRCWMGTCPSCTACGRAWWVFRAEGAYAWPARHPSVRSAWLPRPAALVPYHPSPTSRSMPPPQLALPRPQFRVSCPSPTRTAPPSPNRTSLAALASFLARCFQCLASCGWSWSSSCSRPRDSACHSGSDTSRSTCARTSSLSRLCDRAGGRAGGRGSLRGGGSGSGGAQQLRRNSWRA